MYSIYFSSLSISFIERPQEWCYRFIPNRFCYWLDKSNCRQWIWEAFFSLYGYLHSRSISEDLPNFLKKSFAIRLLLPLLFGTKEGSSIGDGRNCLTGSGECKQDLWFIKAEENASKKFLLLLASTCFLFIYIVYYDYRLLFYLPNPHIIYYKMRSLRADCQMIALEWAEEPTLLNDRFQNWWLMSSSVKKLDDYIDSSPENYCPPPPLTGGRE